MLRDTLVGLIEPMQISAGVDPLALTIRKQASDDRPSCLENPRPERAESSLTENATSPFQAEPAQSQIPLKREDEHSATRLRHREVVFGSRQRKNSRQLPRNGAVSMGRRNTSSKF